MNQTTTVWQRSSFCSAGSCVEVAHDDVTISLRDGKNPDQPSLVFTPEAWNEFQDQVMAFGKSA